MLHATRNMASVFKHVSYLSRLLLVISRIGNAFLILREFTAVVERFVFGYNVHQVIERSSTFAAESESLFQLVPRLRESSPEEFKNFLITSLSNVSIHAMTSVLVSEQKSCRKCGQVLDRLGEKKKNATWW